MIKTLMNNDTTLLDPHRLKIDAYFRKEESAVLSELMDLAEVDPESRRRIAATARKLVLGIRENRTGRVGVEALLNEFSLSSEEGIVLMCLAEALLRIPDAKTQDQLILDKLGTGNWAMHLGHSDSPFVNAASWGLLVTGKVISPERQDFPGFLQRIVARLGEPVIRASMKYAMAIMGNQFVLGQSIEEALNRSRPMQRKGFNYSYDMLGESAVTEADAQSYRDAYAGAIEAIGSQNHNGPCLGPGISVKLSALYPRFEESQRDRVMRKLVPRLSDLVHLARQYDIGFTIDAEEASRLNLSLDVIDAVAKDLGSWEGFGIAVQAYQKRAVQVSDWVEALARFRHQHLMIRLVKGAYWDSEIKWTQQGGYADYPVFTRKPSTDLSYQACAGRLLAARDVIYPQFATHNAYTVAMILELDRQQKRNFEFQRLHGMGEALYARLLTEESLTCRIYAPVGKHADLLAYLVRRLLENGANTSFVYNVVDQSVPVDSLIADPSAQIRSWQVARHPEIPLPRDLYLPRINSEGLDIEDRSTLNRLTRDIESCFPDRKGGQLPDGHVVITNPAKREEIVGTVTVDSPAVMRERLAAADAAVGFWAAMPITERASILNELAAALECNRSTLVTLCIKEAGKTLEDALDEVREAVDFCRYYASQAEFIPSDYQPLGTVLCISPWNFPLAILVGQVSAALVTGNTVLAKPAEQTCLIAMEVLRIARECRLPRNVLQIIQSPGELAGQCLLPDHRIQGVMFTGSTETAGWIRRALADRNDVDVPMIAETGGQNAMIVDSTTLPEQVVLDVIHSGFHSAGQRCSSLRVLFLQHDVADEIITMLAGAMRLLVIGDPCEISTDVGPVIDNPALGRLEQHCDNLDANPRAQLIYACGTDNKTSGSFFTPRLYEIEHLGILTREVFGPIVHVIRYGPDEVDAVIDQINATGYGLTLGIHTRNQSLAQHIAQRAQVGNIYVNRDMVGAVVGAQPFGGRGLSGSGPKAGGPHYLHRLIRLRPDGPTGKQINVEPTNLDYKIDASSPWLESPLQTRVTVVRNFLTWLSDSTLLEREQLSAVIDDAIELIETASAFLAPRQLPGPTGEDNRLQLDGRGLTLLFTDEKTNIAILPVIATLLTGCPVMVLTNNLQLHELLPGWLAAGLPGNTYQVVKPDLSPSQHPGVQAIVVCRGEPYARSLRKQMLERHIPIPLICEDEPRRLLSRLVVEKTVSINITAMGGNAGLLGAGA